MENVNCVLLVDDDKINNFLNEKLLKKLGVAKKIKTSQNGEEALLYLTNTCSTSDGNCCPDLILLDNTMPEMNGVEFMELFNKINMDNHRHVKVAVLTASENPVDREKLESLGIDSYLIKPLTEEKLKSVLEK